MSHGLGEQRNRRKSFLGFTLIELLVAVAILTMVLILFSQLAGGVVKVYRVGKARSEDNNLGRALLDSMTSDLKQAVIRPDLDFVVEGNSASERSIKFYSQRPGTFRTNAPGSEMSAPRSASIVEYILYRSGTNEGYLARRDRPATWTNTRTVIPLGTTNTIDNLSQTTEETRIYDGVVGFDYGFVRADGTVNGSLAASTNAVVGMRVAVAVLDKDGLRVLKSVGRIDDFLNLFSSNGTIQNAGLQTWADSLNQQGASFPNRVVQGVRFYERTIPLSNPYVP